MEKGYGAPFIFMYDDNGRILKDIKVTSFKYVYSEDDSDESEITIEDINPSIVDHPALQENKKIQCIWGYIGGKKSNRRTLYILDTKDKFSEKGTTLTLMCYPKAIYLKLRQGQKVGNGTVGDLAKDLVKDFEVEYQEGDEDYFQISSGRKRSFLNEDLFNTAAIDNTAVVTLKENLFIQGNKSDWNALEEGLDREQGGPYSLVARDETLRIKKRDYGQKSIRLFKYKGEDGHLLSFDVSTDNMSKMAEASNVEAGGWIDDFKEYAMGNIGPHQDSTPRLGQEEFASPRTVEFSSAKKRPLQDGQDPGTQDGVYEFEFDYGIAQFSPDEALRYIESDSNTSLDSKPPELDNKGATLLSTSELESTSISESDSTTLWFYDKWSTESQGILTEDGVTAPVDNTAVIKDAYVMVDSSKRLISREGTAEGIGAEGANKRARSAQKAIQADAKIVGDPQIESGRIVTIDNVGKKNSGNYFIDRAEHLVNTNGFIVFMKLARNASGKTQSVVNRVSTGAKVIEAPQNTEPGEDNFDTEKGKEIPNVGPDSKPLEGDLGTLIP